MQNHLIDLSHSVEDGMITYKGLPAPLICDYWSREASHAHYDGLAEFHIGKIEMVANTGTYLDSLFHRFADGKDLSGFRFFAVPVKVKRFGTFPVRAFGLVGGSELR